MPSCADYGILSLSIQCILFSYEQFGFRHVDPWFVCSMQSLIQMFNIYQAMLSYLLSVYNIHVEVVKPFHIGLFWYTSVLNLDNEVITYYRVTMGDVPVYHRG